MLTESVAHVPCTAVTEVMKAMKRAAPPGTRLRPERRSGPASGPAILTA
jgi:hypothetical protein